MPEENPKLKQFTEELNTLLDKYQYQMTSQLSFTKNCIIPVLSVLDKVPPKTPPVVLKKEEKK